jgi:hypothetical protein
MSKRSVLDWETQTDVRPAVQAWAAKWGYSAVGDSQDGTREFVRLQMGQTAQTRALHMGARWSVGWHVSVRQTGSQVHLEAWITPPPAVRMMTLGLMWKENGVRDRLGGALARGPLNVLLAALGQPPIR